MICPQRSSVVSETKPSLFGVVRAESVLLSLHHLKQVEVKSHDPKENILDIEIYVTHIRLENVSRITQAVINSNCRSITTTAASTKMAGSSTTKLVLSIIFDATKVT